MNNRHEFKDKMTDLTFDGAYDKKDDLSKLDDLISKFKGNE
jgi:hypothetical protein